MSLTEHLTELRSRLIKSFLGIMLTTSVAVLYAPEILDYSIQPLMKVLQDRNRVETILIHKDEKAGAVLAARLDTLPRVRFDGYLKDLSSVSELVKKQIEAKHPIDLIFVSADSIGKDGALVSDLLDKVEPSPSVAYLVTDKDDPVVAELQLEGATVLLEPMRDPVLQRVVGRAAASSGKATGDKLAVLSPLEPFIAYLKIALVVGLFLACPIWLYQAWRFVAPGLYYNEKRVVVPSISAASILFCTGGFFAYYVMFPMMFDFLVNRMMPQSLAGTFTVDNYLGLLMQMTIAFGVVFELPLILAALAAVGIVDGAMLKKFRKYWIIAAFTIAAVLTPTPDPISQVVMAAPLVLFYEVGILLANMMGKRREAQLALMEQESESSG